MGGKSSKRKAEIEVNSNIQDNISGDRQTFTGPAKINKKGSKRNSKESFKKNEKRGKKVKKKTSFADLKENSHSDDKFPSLSLGTDALATSSPAVYRKKSSCPSCDIREVSCGQNRSRSGSEKSLRFSDFNKIVRSSRVYEWELQPPAIALDGPMQPDVDDICYICGVYTGMNVRNCRVCCKAYHDSCLAKIGHTLNAAARRLLEHRVWSCHQCIALSNTLTQEEVRFASEKLDELGISQENISFDEYIKYCTTINDNQLTLDQDACSQRFNAKDTENTTEIKFTQFLDIEATRILNQRAKDSLVHLLTESEVCEARRIFKSLDPRKSGLVSKEDLHGALDTNKFSTSCFYPEDCMMYSPAHLRGVVSWKEFLRERAIFFIGKRPNPSQLDDLTFEDYQSFETIDEEYKTCDSDAEMLEQGKQSKDASNSVKSPTILDALNDQFHLQEQNKDIKNPVGTEGNTASGINPELRNKICQDSLQKAGPWGKETSVPFNRSSDVIPRHKQLLIEKERPHSQIIPQTHPAKLVKPAFGRLVDKVQQSEWKQ